MTATPADIIAKVHALADAVLFEGYMLYPYRANDPKNNVRWQFGVLTPPAYVEADPSERSHLQLDCLVEGADITVTVVARFLQVQQRRVQTADGNWTNSLDVGDATYLPWDEAVVCESTVTATLSDSCPYSSCDSIRVEGAIDIEELPRAGGAPPARLVRERCDLQADVFVDAAPLPGPYGVRRLRIRLENTTSWSANELGRPVALRHSLVAAHLILSVDRGAFVSMIDPPEWARGYAESCDQIGTFPVLAGPPGDRHVILAAPIILYDHPVVAPESTLQFCDATEMDEMLTLRTLTLTEAEKRQARGSDPRAAQLIDEIDNLPSELLDRLHGAIRSMTSVARAAEPTPDEVPPWWNPEADADADPDTDTVLVGNTAIGRGCAVRLQPGRRRADAQDMFLAGRTARVEAVLRDLDGGHHLAVTLDDLVEDGYNPHGRFLYFAPDEVEPIGPRP
jgi:hypothetical protein